MQDTLDDEIGRIERIGRREPGVGLLAGAGRDEGAECAKTRQQEAANQAMQQGTKMRA